MVQRNYTLQCDWCGQTDYIYMRKGLGIKSATKRFISHGWIEYKSGIIDRKSDFFCSEECKELFIKDNQK